jgi:hypothetical protein
MERVTVFRRVVEVKYVGPGGGGVDEPTVVCNDEKLRYDKIVME